MQWGSFAPHESTNGTGSEDAGDPGGAVKSRTARESGVKSRAFALVVLLLWVVGLLQLYLATLNERHDRRSGAWRPAQDFGSLSTRPWTAMPEIKLMAGPVHSVKLSTSDGATSFPAMAANDETFEKDETPESAEAGSDKEWCTRMHSTARVQPGQSWGTLSEAAIEQWKVRRCDKFFCKPNRMEAKGEYECEPLDMPATS